MATVEPSQDDINFVLSICDIERHQAVTLLKKYHTTDVAITNYFEDPTGSLKAPLPPNQWEPSDNMPGFRIDADDTQNMPGMSRPPSRVDNRAGFDVGAAGVGGQFGQSDDTQDADLQRAIAMSQEDMSAQETGVTATGQQFGPANRPHYDPNEWAMTATFSSREVVDHPQPSKRQRNPEQPVLLRGSPESGYLAPLLNIYHSIPLAREAFLLPSFKVLSYGYDPTWWMGTSDENSKSLSVQITDTSNRDRENLLAEVQSLMAFLDNTSRAYGSVDALADLHLFKNHNPESPLSRFLEVWMTGAVHQVQDEPLTQIFVSAASKGSHTPFGAIERKNFLCLEAPVNVTLNQTLVDLLDSTIWHDTITNIDDVWMEHCAEVFTMRLHDPQRKGNGLGLEVPAVWYPDRYMYNYRDTSYQMRMQLVEIRKEINTCVVIQRRCESAQAPDKRIINIREVLQAAAKLSTRLQSAEVDDSRSHVSGSDSDTFEHDKSSNDLDIQMKLILQRIDDKVQLLEQRKAELQSKMREISSTLTQSTQDPALTPQMRYTLQGVSTKPHVSYLRRRQQKQIDLIDFEDSQATSEAWQWWRLAWQRDEPPLASTQGPKTQAEASQQQANQASQIQEQSYSNEPLPDSSKPFTIRKVSEAEVLDAARNENDSVLLVYASDNALESQVTPLSPVLKKLVEQDNRAFQQELMEEQGLNKRRSSLDTNTTIMDNIPLDTEGDSMREMTPMSTASPPRGLDGQASPKRAKFDSTYFPVNRFEEDPPPYEPVVQMQERKGNKIGLLADKMMERVDSEAAQPVTESEGPIHIEHANAPLR